MDLIELICCYVGMTFLSFRTWRCALKRVWDACRPYLQYLENWLCRSPLTASLCYRAQSLIVHSSAYITILQSGATITWSESVVSPKLFCFLSVITMVYCLNLQRASSYAVVILSIRLSVCPSHACFVTKPDNALRIFCYCMKGQLLYSSFLTTTVVGGRRRLPSEICAQSHPPLRKTPTLTDFRL